jgi:hypothetical protein
MAANGATWTTVPLEIAKRHALYGIGGWLWLVAVNMVVGPIRIGLSFGPLYGSIDYAAIPPALATFITIEMAVNVIIALWSLGNLFLLFSKSPWFPRSFAGLLATSAVFVPMDAVVAKAVMDSAGQPMSWAETFDPETFREVARSIVGAAVWIPYSFISRRVNVTFLNRVRADDPLLRENTAEVF